MFSFTSRASLAPQRYFRSLPVGSASPLSLRFATMSSSAAQHKDGSTNWASKDGQFRRQESSFRESIAPGAKHPPAVGRYKLFVALACPWAHRALLVRKLKGIDKVDNLLPVYVVDSLLGPEGWSFQPYGLTHPDLKGLGVPGTGLVPGHEDKKRIKDFYLAADPNYTARSTVPVIWDEELKTVVNNESSEIIRNLNTAFDEFIPSEHRGVTYYPEALRGEIDSLNEWVYSDVNNGVYKSGFATTQEAYESNVVPLFKSLDRLEALLAKNGGGEKDDTYLVGKQLTEADIRLYTTIVRFDPVYFTHFKCNIDLIRSERFRNLNAWLKRLYWKHPGFKETTDFESIKAHYYQSHPQNNPHRIVPVGPEPHIEPL
ncbi:unnamed protein product [Parajaminaea phylloscopi]